MRARAAAGRPVRRCGGRRTRSWLGHGAGTAGRCRRDQAAQADRLLNQKGAQPTGPVTAAPSQAACVLSRVPGTGPSTRPSASAYRDIGGPYLGRPSRQRRLSTMSGRLSTEVREKPLPRATLSTGMSCSGGGRVPGVCGEHGDIGPLPVLRHSGRGYWKCHSRSGLPKAALVHFDAAAAPAAVLPCQRIPPRH